MGGLKAVMYTDAFQGSIMFSGLLILLVATYYKLGGITVAHQRLSDMKDLAVKYFGAKGHTGWTGFPEPGSEYWLIVVTTIILGVGIGVLSQPQLIVRFMTVKSNRELNRAVLIGGIFILMAVGVPFIVGPLTNVYFSTKTVRQWAVSPCSPPIKMLPRSSPCISAAPCRNGLPPCS